MNGYKQRQADWLEAALKRLETARKWEKRTKQMHATACAEVMIAERDVEEMRRAAQEVKS